MFDSLKKRFKFANLKSSNTICTNDVLRHWRPVSPVVQNHSQGLTAHILAFVTHSYVYFHLYLYFHFILVFVSVLAKSFSRTCCTHPCLCDKSFVKHNSCFRSQRQNAEGSMCLRLVICLIALTLPSKYSCALYNSTNT